MKTLCYIVTINSSLGGLLERLTDIGAHWTTTNVVCGSITKDMMEITIYVREHLAAEVEDLIKWYV